MQRNCGLMLIDLLLTLALVSALLSIAVPTFTGLMLDARMTSSINSLVHAIHLGKQSAGTRLSDIALCKSANGRTCAHARHWQDGWALFENRDRDHPPAIDLHEPILAIGGSFISGTIAANREYFIFRPFNIRSTNGTLTFCDHRGVDAARALIISPTGRPRTAASGPSNRRLQCPA